MRHLKSALIIEYEYMRLLLFTQKQGVFTYFDEKRIKYDGFDSNGFINPDDVFSKIQSLYSEAKHIGGTDKSAEVVLPGAFFKYAVADNDLAIQSGVIGQGDIDSILADCGARLPSFEAVQKRPLFFKTISDPVVDNPIGQKSDRLKVKASVEYLRLSVKELFDNCAKRLGKEFSYTSYGAEIAAKADRDNHCSQRIIVALAGGSIDIVSCFGGVPTASMSDVLGADHVCYSLAEELRLEDGVAREVLHGVNLNLNFTDKDKYYIAGETYSVAVVNTCVAEAIIYLASETKKAIDAIIEEELPPVFLTGSELCSVRGVKDLFEDETGAEITVLNSSTLNLKGCDNYLAAALCEKLKTKSVLKYIKNRLKSIL